MILANQLTMVAVIIHMRLHHSIRMVMKQDTPGTARKLVILLGNILKKMLA